MRHKLPECPAVSLISSSPVLLPLTHHLSRHSLLMRLTDLLLTHQGLQSVMAQMEVQLLHLLAMSICSSRLCLVHKEYVMYISHMYII